MLHMAKLRLARHYASRLEALGARAMRHGEWDAALAAFDTEWPHLESGFSWACASGELNGEASRACVAFVSGPGLWLLDNRMGVDRRLDWLQRALPFARRGDDPDALLGILLNIGMALKDLGRPREALAFDAEVLCTARRTRDAFHVARACSGLGVCFRRMGDLRRALSWHRHALAKSRDGVSADVELNATNNIGVVLAEMRRHGEAADHFHAASELAERLNRPREQAMLLGNSGMAMYDAGRPAEAVPLLERSLEAARHLRLARLEATALGQLGEAHAALGDFAQAVRMHRAQLEVARGTKGPRELGLAMTNLACAVVRQGGSEGDQQALFEEGLASLAAAQAPLTQAVALERWAAALHARGYAAEASAAAGRAEIVRQRLGRR